MCDARLIAVNDDEEPSYTVRDAKLGRADPLEA
jgi:hypothetical protein